MKIKLLSVVALLAVFLSGCATGPGYQEYASNIKPAVADQGRIYVYRTSVLGAAIQPKVKLNGNEIGKAVPQGFFYVDQPAGDYQISTSTEVKRSLSISLAPGEEKYVRLDVKMGMFAGHIKPVLVDQSEGKEQIKKTKYVGE